MSANILLRECLQLDLSPYHLLIKELMMRTSDDNCTALLITRDSWRRNRMT